MDEQLSVDAERLYSLMRIGMKLDHRVCLPLPLVLAWMKKPWEKLKPIFSELEVKGYVLPSGPGVYKLLRA